ncbi:hypothetical protein CHS0354_038643 [Potamilus streckersoni]|uniref:Uncharacterized protein n=1 Tax=Potamilus streckersoni TaxID=2493646 RepID=A0AAE0W8B1_9BIVA|nr:hypothetical protein CHS0354_038643 [Potamilus streckersoni]
MKVWDSTGYFLLILTLNFKMNFIKGIIWTSNPSPVIKCKGDNVHLTWKYVKEPGEDIKQLQWLFNRTELIASISVRHGFNVELNYKGRVERSSGDNGILLKNISAQDIGNYTLYPVRAWEESPNIQSVWLNVIEPTMKPECMCESLLNSTEWSSGKTFGTVAVGCNLKINSSFCCPKGPDIEYCVNDPEKLCVSLNLTENSTQNRNPDGNTEGTTQNFVNEQKVPSGKDETDAILLDLHRNNYIIISVLIISCLNLVFTVWIHYRKERRKHCKMIRNKDVYNQKKPRKRNRKDFPCQEDCLESIV